MLLVSNSATGKSCTGQELVPLQTGALQQVPGTSQVLCWITAKVSQRTQVTYPALCVQTFLHSQHLAHKGQDRLGVNRAAVLWTHGHQCQKTVRLFCFFSFWCIKTFLVNVQKILHFHTIWRCAALWSRNGLFLLWNKEHHLLAHRAGSLHTAAAPCLLWWGATEVGCSCCSWAGPAPQQRGGESGPRLFKCRKTSCMCSVIWALELENL